MATRNRCDSTHRGFRVHLRRGPTSGTEGYWLVAWPTTAAVGLSNSSSWVVVMLHTPPPSTTAPETQGGALRLRLYDESIAPKTIPSHGTGRVVRERLRCLGEHSAYGHRSEGVPDQRYSATSRRTESSFAGSSGLSTGSVAEVFSQQACGTTHPTSVCLVSAIRKKRGKREGRRKHHHHTCSVCNA